MQTKCVLCARVSILFRFKSRRHQVPCAHFGRYGTGWHVYIMTRRCVCKQYRRATRGNTLCLSTHQTPSADCWMPVIWSPDSYQRAFDVQLGTAECWYPCILLVIHTARLGDSNNWFPAKRHFTLHSNNNKTLCKTIVCTAHCDIEFTHELICPLTRNLSSA